ncbi:GntR family transcriptional regulator [Maritalea sp.]|uniref:GntR family transcriptional regulator n=1 Tax=Maritalea sp. TaxID=2003361 RepID=UPI003EF69D0E
MNFKSEISTESFNRLSLSEQVESALRREITEGRIAPGGRVEVANYQKIWQVSSTPFRDALRALEGQGLVTIEPRKGAFVAQMNVETLQEIFDVRIALECMAVELATAHIPKTRAQSLVETYSKVLKGEATEFDLEKEDRVVHELAREYCGNGRIKKLLMSQMDLFSWAQHTIVAELPHSFSLALPEHLEVARSYLAGDPKLAIEAMRIHLENSRDRLVSLREGQMAKI